MTDLGTLGGAYSKAADLNDLRHVVGTAERANGTRVAFLWTLAGGMQDLGTLGGPASSARPSIGSGRWLAPLIFQTAIRTRSYGQQPPGCKTWARWAAGIVLL